jgi:fibronectin type 3 domain-containing protein
VKKLCSHIGIVAPGHRAFLIRLLIPLLFLLPSCGQKAPPTLKSFERPEAPSALIARHREGKIILLWSYPGNLRKTIGSFEILRSEGDAFARIGTVGNDKSSFTDPSFEVNHSYTYKVIARNLRDIPSSDSNLITAKPLPLPPPPEEIRFTVRSDILELSWGSSGEGVCYRIYRTAERGNYSDEPIHREPVCGSSFRDHYLSPDRPLYYKISAMYNTSLMDEGYPSREIEVNPSHYVPSPPSDLRYVENGVKVFLIWKESPEPWVRGYRIYRKEEGSKDFTLIGEAKLPAFTDSERVGGKAWYMIRAAGPESLSDPTFIEVIKRIEQ